MAYLVTRANAVALLLFHVEQSPGSEWFWRWRPLADLPPAYLDWREGASLDPRVVQHCEVAGCRVEAQWRPTPDEPWRQAALHEPAIGTARFRVFAKEDFFAPRGFRAFAEVAGMVACYHFGPLELHAGSEITLEGRSDGPFADNVLLAPGEFLSEDSMVRIENEGPSTGSLLPAKNPACNLCVAPGAAERKFFVKRPARQAGAATPNTLSSYG